MHGEPGVQPSHSNVHSGVVLGVHHARVHVHEHVTPWQALRGCGGPGVLRQSLELPASCMCSIPRGL